jgi:hypothetical protein
MSAYKLQKLVYYSQAWHLVWADEPLFAARIPTRWTKRSRALSMLSSAPMGTFRVNS